MLLNIQAFAPQILCAITQTGQATGSRRRRQLAVLPHVTDRGHGHRDGTIERVGGGLLFLKTGLRSAENRGRKEGLADEAREDNDGNFGASPWGN